jgi:prolyl 4-hydroxylase
MAFGDLQHFIRVYDQHLDAAICGRMMQSFTALERFQRNNGKGVRAGLEESAWTELNVTRLSDPTFSKAFSALTDRALEQYNRDVGLRIPLQNSLTLSDLVMKRYRSGTDERFQLHFDAIHHLANRYMVFLWYLNDVEAGGETRFPQLNYSVSARAGRLLMFPPYWMYQHEGIAPASGDKFILSTYLLFTSGVGGESQSPAPEERVR